MKARQKFMDEWWDAFIKATQEQINQADKEDEFVKEIDLILYEESEEWR